MCVRYRYYIAGGAVVGTGLLAAALYYYDRKGGDIKQQVLAHAQA